MNRWKIVKRDAVKTATWADELTVGFTSGVFDILHAGHIDYLEKAKAQCDVLIVGVNSDASTAINKPGRPIIKAEHRVRLIAALGCVNYVFVFDELNNHANIQIIKPNIYFKADQYSMDKLTSASLVESYGGKVVRIPMIEDISTSVIIKKIQSLSQ